ncbi:hypothetical protein MTBBW1_1040066 [Desulfamplus magnetovallimortis]|uniref:Uncharacterized protein n=1 Tax=Desulfamplus magnetovallimortis TaxID=1246637 RepID=A0A1W1H554_9BACT|nr:hypothetical protein MTBBW1_1040066 [Desulfamplus magnetovallimortis]
MKVVTFSVKRKVESFEIINTTALSVRVAEEYSSLSFLTIKQGISYITFGLCPIGQSGFNILR